MVQALAGIQRRWYRPLLLFTRQCPRRCFHDHKNLNNPARFISTIAAMKEGEVAAPPSYLVTQKIADEARYDGLYAVCTDLLDDDVSEIFSIP